LSGDYDLDSLFTSIRDVLASTDFEGDIDVGDLHITVKQGTVLERDKDDNYIIDGHLFKKNQLEAALSA